MDELNPAMRDLFLGGEDEEVQDWTPPVRAGDHQRDAGLHEPGARHAYLNVDIRDNADGSATVWYFTNDRDNDGVPDRTGSGWDELLTSWDEHWPSATEARRHIGGSGRDASGRVVTVHHNGRRVP
jgi:hypothetical protein